MTTKGITKKKNVAKITPSMIPVMDTILSSSTSTARKGIDQSHLELMKMLQRQQPNVFSSCMDWKSPLEFATVSPDDATLAFLAQQCALEGKEGMNPKPPDPGNSVDVSKQQVAMQHGEQGSEIPTHTTFSK